MKTMRKMILALVFVAGASTLASAQVDTKNIGLRLGWANEISYQQPLSSTNRLELDFGIPGFYNYLALGASGVYQWVWDLPELATGFKWYAGVGASALLFNNYFNFGPSGQIGIEYNFDIPLQLALDYRPTFYLLNPSGGYYFQFSPYGAALSVRYKF